MDKKEIYKIAKDWYINLDEWSQASARNIFYLDREDIGEDEIFYMWYLEVKPEIYII